MDAFVEKLARPGGFEPADLPIRTRLLYPTELRTQIEGGRQIRRGGPACCFRAGFPSWPSRQRPGGRAAEVAGQGLMGWLASGSVVTRAAIHAVKRLRAGAGPASSTAGHRSSGRYRLGFAESPSGLPSYAPPGSPSGDSSPDGPGLQRPRSSRQGTSPARGFHRSFSLSGFHRMPRASSPGLPCRRPDSTGLHGNDTTSFWLRWLDLNQRPTGYEPADLPTDLHRTTGPKGPSRVEPASRTTRLVTLSSTFAR